MDKVAARIVHHDFGSSVGRVASVLLSRGRLSQPDLIRLLAPYLVPRDVRIALLIMIQHNLLTHAPIENPDSPEIFELVPSATFARLRFGRYVASAQDHYGDLAARICILVLRHGRLPVQKIVHTLEKEADAKLVFDTILKMLQSHALSLLKPSSSISPVDAKIARERKMIKNLGPTPTPKQLTEVRNTVEQESLNEELDPDGNDSDDDNYAIKSSKRVKLSYSNGSQADYKSEPLYNKNPSLRVSTHHFDILLRNRVFSEAAKNRFSLAGQFVFDRILSHALSSDKSIKEIISPFVSTSSMLNFDPHPTKTSQSIDPVKHLRASFPEQIDTIDGPWRLSEKTPLELVTETCRLMSYADDISGQLARTAWLRPRKPHHPDPAEQQQLLAQKQQQEAQNTSSKIRKGFSIDELTKDTTAQDDASAINQTSNSWMSESEDYQIDYANISSDLGEALIDGIICRQIPLDTTGADEQLTPAAALRVMKVLQERGKLGEYQIARLAFVSFKVTRTIINWLSTRNYIHLQEVPKGSKSAKTETGQANSSFWLWYVDRHQRKKAVLNHSYQLLENLLVRKEAETSHRANLLRKVYYSQPPDKLDSTMYSTLFQQSQQQQEHQHNHVNGTVNGEHRLEDLLSPVEQSQLAELEWKLESLDIAIQRAEQDVFILKDLPLPITEEDDLGLL